MRTGGNRLIGILQCPRPSAEPHPAHHVVSLDEMMSERSRDVHDDQRSKQIRQYHMRFFEQVMVDAVRTGTESSCGIGIPEQVVRKRSAKRSRECPSSERCAEQ